MSLQIDYQLKLTFQGPLITQKSGTIALGLDVEMQTYEEHYVINGSLIKGNIRHTLKEFNELLDEKLKNDIKNWFGNETTDQYKPQRTQVDFDFFWTSPTKANEKSPNQRTRISIDPETGTVNKGALQIVEDCFPVSSENPVFSGKISARFTDYKEQKRFKKWIDKALEYIPAIGSFKGVGWGKLIDANLKEIEKPFHSNTRFKQESYPL